jgi:hypothetical protein
MSKMTFYDSPTPSDNIQNYSFHSTPLTPFKFLQVGLVFLVVIKGRQEMCKNLEYLIGRQP